MDRVDYRPVVQAGGQVRVAGKWSASRPFLRTPSNTVVVFIRGLAGCWWAVLSLALRWASQNGLSAGSARTLSTQGQSLRQSGLPGGLPPVVRTTGAIPPVVRTTEHIRPVVRTTGGIAPVVRATGGSSRHVQNRQRASHMGTRVRKHLTSFMRQRGGAPWLRPRRPDLEFALLVGDHPMRAR